MPQGGRLTIETDNVFLDEHYVASHPDAQTGKHVLLAISDSGCGMDAATLERVFEPFFTTKAVNQGTGLGLAMVYGIVRQSGGHIEVYSELNMGTTFKVYLPRARDLSRPSSSHDGRSLPPRGDESVLLVEDEDAVRALATMVLQKQGYSVLAARNGDQALRLCEQHLGDIDLIATDLVMPGMSGRELAEQVLAMYPGTKLLYMSGYADDAVVRHGVLESHLPFLQKPYTPEVLARKVREALDAKSRTKMDWCATAGSGTER
jgi:CheY-like chemotaxis protein